jgi:hypothetical protein
MLQRAFEVGVPAAWVIASKVYGEGEELQRWLEARGRSYVLPQAGDWVDDGTGGKGRAPLCGCTALYPTKPLPGGRDGYSYSNQGPDPMRTLITRPTARERHRSSSSCQWSLSAGRPRRASSEQRTRWGWTSMRCVAGTPGTGTSP